jgi:hypothetical protein
MGVRVIRVTGAGIAAVATCAVIAACTSTVPGQPAASGTQTTTSGAPGQPASGPRVAKEALQKVVVDQLARSGVTPQSVACPQDLIGQVGQSVRCDVTVSAVNSFQIAIAVTGVKGSEVNYAMTPSVSQSQLAVSVADMVNRSTQTAPDAVTCESDLDGRVGATAYCNVTVAGAATRQAVVVTKVQGLAMDYGLAAAQGSDPAQPPTGTPPPGPGGGPVLAPNGGLGATLPKAVAEGALLAQLRQTGQAPDSASCAGDMPISVGATLPCTAVTAGRGQNYLLVVASVVNGSATFKVLPAQ